MPQRDGPAAHVHLLVRDPERVLAVHGHGRERLVHLDDVDLVQGDAELAEELGDRDGRADAHDARGDARDGRADELGHDGLAEVLGFGALHQEDGGGLIEVCSLVVV